MIFIVGYLKNGLNCCWFPRIFLIIRLLQSIGTKITIDRIDQIASRTNVLFSFRSSVVIRGYFQCGRFGGYLSAFGELWMTALTAEPGHGRTLFAGQVVAKSIGAVLFIPGGANSNRALPYRLDLKGGIFSVNHTVSQNILSLNYNPDYKRCGF